MGKMFRMMILLSIIFFFIGLISLIFLTGGYLVTRVTSLDIFQGTILLMGGGVVFVITSIGVSIIHKLEDNSTIVDIFTVKNKTRSKPARPPRKNFKQDVF